jgi:chemotaxis protein CheX
MTSIDACLTEVGESIWSQTLGVSLTPQPDTDMGELAMIEGQVQVTGGWRGTLVLQCSVGAARRAAGVMFNRHESELTPEDVRDTVGELANMIGGTVKSMVAADGCFLSLPIVIEGSDFNVRALNTKIIARQAFDDAGEPVVVTVLEAMR